VREELDRGLGRLERGDAGGDEFLPRLFDELLPQPAGDDGLFGVFFFLDEIQRLPKWELYLKKYYDLNFPNSLHRIRLGVFGDFPQQPGKPAGEDQGPSPVAV